MTIYRNACLAVTALLSSSLPAFAGWDATTGTYEWDPLLTAGSFSGIFTDLKTLILGLITITIVMLGASMLINHLRR